MGLAPVEHFSRFASALKSIRHQTTPRDWLSFVPEVVLHIEQELLEAIASWPEPRAEVREVTLGRETDVPLTDDGKTVGDLLYVLPNNPRLRDALESALKPIVDNLPEWVSVEMVVGEAVDLRANKTEVAIGDKDSRSKISFRLRDATHRDTSIFEALEEVRNSSNLETISWSEYIPSAVQVIRTLIIEEIHCPHGDVRRKRLLVQPNRSDLLLQSNSHPGECKMPSLGNLLGAAATDGALRRELMAALENLANEFPDWGWCEFSLHENNGLKCDFGIHFLPRQRA